MNRKKVELSSGEELEYLSFSSLETLSCVKHLFTTRKGGVSKGIYSTLNVSFARGDNPDSVRENYLRVAEVLCCELEDFVCSDQTHTANIRVVTDKDKGSGVTKEKEYTDIDGLITNIPGIALTTIFADCVPLYFVDPVLNIIGLAHSGWRGTALKIGAEMVSKMQDHFGSRPEDIYGAIGPSICSECYEVSEDVAEQMTKAFPNTDDILRKGNEKGKYQLDLWMANKIMLHQAGIPWEQIEVTDICTCHNPEYLFSHRASNGKRGNLGAFLMLNKS